MKSVTNLTVVNLDIEGDVYYDSIGPLNLGNIAYIYTYQGTNEYDLAVFTVEIGLGTENTPNSTPCTIAFPPTCVNWNVVSVGNSAGRLNTGVNVTNVGILAGEENSAFSTNNIGREAGRYNTAYQTNNIGDFAGWMNSGVASNNIGRESGRYNSAQFCNNIGVQAGMNNTGMVTNNIGLSAGTTNSGTYCNNIGASAGGANTADYVNNIGQEAGGFNNGLRSNNIGFQTGKNNTAPDTNNLGTLAGRFNSAENSNNIGFAAGEYNTGLRSNNIGHFAGRYNTGQRSNNIGEQAGQNNTGLHCSHNGFQAGMTNTFDYCYTNGRSSACTATNQFVFGSSSFPLHLRLPSDTGSYCTGASYDTCLTRGRAGAFTLDTDQDLYTTGFFCAGAGCTSSAPTSTATGVYDSGIRTVRSCTPGAGIASCTVTDGDLAVAASPASLPTYTTVAVSDNGDGTGSATCNANHCLFTLGSVAWALGLSYTVTVSNTLIGSSSYPRAALVYADVEDNAYAQAGQPGTGSIAVRIFAADIPSKTAFTIDLLAAA